MSLTWLFEVPNENHNHLAVIVSLLLVGAAGVLRLLAARGDLWLDEIVSLLLVSQQESPWTILTEWRQETNHVLASWVMFAWGGDATVWQLRLPAVVAGTAAVPVAGLIGARRSRLEAVLAMLLVGGSYVLIHYSSEARGYAYVMLFSLLSFHLLAKAMEGGSRWWGLLFAVVAVCGFLAQLTYLYCYIALGVWSVWHLAARPAPMGTMARQLLVWHALPSGFLAWFYYVNIRHMTSTGGPSIDVADVIVETLSLGQGGPESGALAIVIAGAALAAVVAGLVLVRAEGADSWIFFAGAIVVIPAVLMLVLRREEIYPRYFVVSLTFLLLLESRLLAWLFQRGRLAKAAVVVALGGYLVGNAVHTMRLMEVGRGDYTAWLAFLEQQTDAPLATLASDHDQRHLVVLGFARQRGETAKEMIYFRRGEWPAEGPQWLLAHSLRRDPQAPDEVTTPTGMRYELVGEFPFAGLSGWHELVYRRVTGLQRSSAAGGQTSRQSP